MFTKDNETYRKDIIALLEKMDGKQLNWIYLIVTHMMGEVE